MGVHADRGREPRVVERHDVCQARAMQPLKNERVEERIEGVDDARGDAVREFGAVHVWVTPQELPLDATVRIAPPDRDTGTENLDVALARWDAVHCTFDRVPLDLRTVERIVKRDATVPVRLAPDVLARIEEFGDRPLPLRQRGEEVPQVASGSIDAAGLDTP